MTLPTPLRWFLVPVIAMAACSAIWVGSKFVADGLRLAVSPEEIDAAIPLDVRYGLLNAAAAAAFVLAGAIIAPRARILVSLILYAAGASIAWFVLSTWWFPESHPRAYQLSRVPLTLTLLGGLVGVVVIVVLHNRSFLPSWDVRRDRPDSGDAAG